MADDNTAEAEGGDLAALARSWDDNAAEERRAMGRPTVSVDEAVSGPYVADTWETAASELRAALAAAAAASDDEQVSDKPSSGAGRDLAALRDLAEGMDSVAMGLAGMSDTPQHGPPIAEWARQIRDIADRLAATPREQGGPDA